MMETAPLGRHSRPNCVSEADWYSYQNGGFANVQSIRRVNETIYCLRKNEAHFYYGTAQEILALVEALPAPTPLPWPPTERAQPVRLSKEMVKHTSVATQSALLSDFDINSAFDDLL